MKPWPFYTDDGFMLRHSLFGAVKLTKNADLDKYSYSGYGISFDVGGFNKSVVIFGFDMSSSAHIDNKKKIF